MFLLKVFSIYDSKADGFLQPFFAENTAVAIRSFTRAANDQASDFHRYAGDYTLFEIGEWNRTRGDWLQYEAKVNLGLAEQYISQAAPAALREVS